MTFQRFFTRLCHAKQSKPFDPEAVKLFGTRVFSILLVCGSDNDQFFLLQRLFSPTNADKRHVFFLFLPPSPLVLSWEKTVFPQSELLLRCCMQWHCPVCLSLPHESSMCFRSRSLAWYILFNGLLLLPIGCLRVSTLVRFQGKPLITLNDFYAVCSC